MSFRSRKVSQALIPKDKVMMDFKYRYEVLAGTVSPKNINLVGREIRISIGQRNPKRHQMTSIISRDIVCCVRYASRQTQWRVISALHVHSEYPWSAYDSSVECDIGNELRD